MRLVLGLTRSEPSKDTPNVGQLRATEVVIPRSKVERVAVEMAQLDLTHVFHRVREADVAYLVSILSLSPHKPYA